jgi:hypothetical protein
MPQILSVEGHASELDDILLAKRAHDTLAKHYPNHMWGVNVDSEQGVLTVKAFNISGRYGFMLKLSTVYRDPDLRCIIRGGGEILERAGMIRGRWDGETLPFKIEGVKPQHQPHGRLII